MVSSASSVELANKLLHPSPDQVSHLAHGLDRLAARVRHRPVLQLAGGNGAQLRRQRTVEADNARRPFDLFARDPTRLLVGHFDADLTQDGDGALVDTLVRFGPGG